jgi:hypothetical protein
MSTSLSFETFSINTLSAILAFHNFFAFTQSLPYSMQWPSIE